MLPAVPSQQDERALAVRHDPEQERVEKERTQKTLSARFLAAFNKDKLEGLRRGREVNRDLEKLADDTGWGGRPITEITALEVRDVIKQYKDRGNHAHNLLGYIRRLFNWAIDQQVTCASK